MIRSEAHPVRSTVVTAAALVIAAVWIISGLAKATDFAEFRRIVEGHGVIPKPFAPALVLLPGVEVVAGMAVLAFGGRARIGSVSAVVASLALLGTLTFYLLLVPNETLVRLGCGCHGVTGFIPGVESVVRGHTKTVLANAMLAGVHVPLIAASPHARQQIVSLRSSPPAPGQRSGSTPPCCWGQSPQPGT